MKHKTEHLKAPMGTGKLKIHGGFKALDAKKSEGKKAERKRG